MNIDYTLWPNPDGNLGNIKVQIPDGVTSQWPDGDALVNNFIYKDGKLVGFVDTKALIENESKSTVMPYDFVDITVDKHLESLMTFNAGERCKYLNVKYEVVLPVGYKRLAYLESTGTQWIDTGIKLSNECEVKCELNLSDLDTTAYFYGAKTTWLVDDYSACFQYSNNQRFITLIFGKKYVNFNEINPTERITTSVSSKGFIVNGKLKTVDNVEVFETPSSCVLYSLRSVNYVGYKIKARVYSFSIARAGEMWVNYVPALDPEGAPCMYDIISQQPFYNSGTGDFLYPGAETQVVTSDLDETFYAKMTEHGIRKLYHVPENFSGSKDEYAVENGFKQLVEPPMPTEGYWTPEWTETDTQLICNWIEVEVDVSEIQ